jgi:hypothetical protein
MEYRVEILGGALKGARPEELEALLNKVDEQDWTLCKLSYKPNTNQLWVVLQRDEKDEGARSRRRSWLADWS